MEWVMADCRIKYNGQFYEAGEKFTVKEEDLPDVLKAGATQTSPARGRPKGRTREDSTLKWDEV